MEIKSIKMSPKKGGNGYVSSYSVNIGSNEAKKCGLTGAIFNRVIVKVIDPDNQRIEIKVKTNTLTEEILGTVIELAKTKNELSNRLTMNIPGARCYNGVWSVNIGALMEAQFDKNNPYTIDLRKHEAKYLAFLLNLSFETLTDLMTLMYMGRDKDADMTLPSELRFANYWSDLEGTGCFSEGAEVVASQIMEKTPLPEYLMNGSRIYHADIQRKVNEDDAPHCEDEEEYIW